VVEYLRVFRQVGFFIFCAAGSPLRPRVDPGPFQKGRLIMYIGGGLVTLVIIVLVVLFLVRGF
jgi:hypothetical protein